MPWPALPRRPARLARLARRPLAPVAALDPSLAFVAYNVQEFGLTLMGAGVVSAFAAGTAHMLRNAAGATTAAPHAPAAAPVEAAAPVAKPAPAPVAEQQATPAPAATLELADIKSELQQAAAAAVAAVKSAAAEPAAPAPAKAAAAPAPNGAAVKPGLTVEEATQVGAPREHHGPRRRTGRRRVSLLAAHPALLTLTFPLPRPLPSPPPPQQVKDWIAAWRGEGEGAAADAPQAGAAEPPTTRVTEPSMPASAAALLSQMTADAPVAATPVGQEAPAATAATGAEEPVLAGAAAFAPAGEPAGCIRAGCIWAA